MSPHSSNSVLLSPCGISTNLFTISHFREMLLWLSSSLVLFDISLIANKQNRENIVHKGGLVSQFVANPPEAKFLGFKHSRKMADF